MAKIGKTLHCVYVNLVHLIFLSFFAFLKYVRYVYVDRSSILCCSHINENDILGQCKKKGIFYILRMIITTIFKMSFLEAFVQKRKYNIYTLNFREVKNHAM